MTSVNLKSVSSSSRLYELTLKPRYSLLKKVFLGVWTPTVLIFLVYFGFAEAYSPVLFEYLMAAGLSSTVVTDAFVPLVTILRAVIVVEAIGYFYHRFFQHLGFMTRTWHKIRRNQKYHWIHHMVFYPIGELYRRKTKYKGAEPFPWSWIIPIAIVVGLFLNANGINLGTITFVVAGLSYVNLVRVTHERFHYTNHGWVKRKYFKFLEDVHILHHWDQGKNYTIVNPVMDMLFGTYLRPKSHRTEVKQALKEYDLTRSDIINWRYLLIEATPAEYAAFISAARQYPSGLRKVNYLLTLLQQRVEIHSNDSEAKELYAKAVRCLKEIGTDNALKILKKFPSSI